MSKVLKGVELRYLNIEKMALALALFLVDSGERSAIKMNFAKARDVRVDVIVG